MVRSPRPFETEGYLARFAEICRGNRIYQGHGWGLALRREGRWIHYKNLTPIWEDRLAGFGRTELLAVHARSAFRDEGIVVENNMPFSDGELVFIFNGELRGVRIKVPGRIGAEKIFNFIRRFRHGDSPIGSDEDTRIREEDTRIALTRAVGLIAKRSDYIRAMNILMTDGRRIYIHGRFGEDPDYFTLHYRSDHRITAVCSEPLDEVGWSTLPNGVLMTV